jgi:HK97 family phage major capsid protein
MDNLELKKFEELVGSAIAKFGGIDGEVSGIKEAVAELRGQINTLTAMTPQTQIDRDMTNWSKFVDFCRALKDKNFDRVREIQTSITRDLTLTQNMNETTDSEGAYVVPVDIRTSVIRIIQKYGLARQECTRIPLSTDEAKFPMITGMESKESPAAGIVNWVGEAGAIKLAAPVFDQLTLTIKKLAAIVPATGEFLADTYLQTQPLLVQMIGEQMAKEEDRVCLLGDVTAGDPFDGVLHDAGNDLPITGHDLDNATYFNADTLLEMTTGVDPMLMDGAKFYLSPTVFNVIRTFKDTNKNYIWDRPGANGAPGTIWGYPYVLTHTMPSKTVAEAGAGVKFILFGNMKHMYMGDRMGLSVAVSEHVGFTQYLTYFRFLERIGFKVALPQAFITMSTT